MDEKTPHRRLTRKDGRPPLLRECVVLMALNVAYNVVMRLSRGNAAAAINNAHGVVSVERFLGIAIVPQASHWLWSIHTLALICSYWYVIAQWVVAFGLLAWVWIKLPTEYYRVRQQWLWITAIGLLVFAVFPVAPPRLAETGVIDVIARLQTPGNFHHGALAAAADEYGAMPSLHMAWAAWCAACLWMIRSTIVRIAAVAFVLFTAFVVVTTGNHYVTDVIAGLAVMPVAAIAQALAARTIGRQGDTTNQEIRANA